MAWRIVASIVLLIITPVTLHASERWWAFSSHLDGAYGAAWDFPTKEAAISAATAECEKRTSPGTCLTGTNDTGNATEEWDCLAVYRVTQPDGRVYHIPMHWEIGFGRKPYIMTVEGVHKWYERAIAEDKAHSTRHRLPQDSYALEMYHCPRTGETWIRR